MCTVCFLFGFSALNYGAIGSVFGYESTHGFDDQGIRIIFIHITGIIIFFLLKGCQTSKEGNTTNW